MTVFSPPAKGPEQEEGETFRPKFDSAGLVTAIACDSESGEVLMLAHMNAEALHKTLETGKAHYFSRSRQVIWLKGETSGNVQMVESLATDCDQDAVLLKVRQQGAAAACHTGRISCFYRTVRQDGEGGYALVADDREKRFDSDEVYGGK